MTFFEDMPDLGTVDASDDVAAMANAEKRKWLTVAEGQNIADAWKATRDAVDAALEKYEENPESEAEVVIFAFLSGLSAEAFLKKVGNSALKITSLSPPK